MTGNPTTSHACLKKSDDLAILTSIDPQRFVILELASTQPLVLTGTGAAVWAALDFAFTTADVIDLLASDYSVDAADVGGHIEAVIAELISRRLLESTV